MKLKLTHPPGKDLRFWVLLAAFLLLCIALVKPSVQSKREIYNFLFVIDITQSMNARDYHVDGLPPDRLSFVKQSIKYTLQNLPCHSKVGLGLFTTKNMFLLFEPLEICSHYSVIERSLMKIDWRMAWAANSHIARGLYTSIRDTHQLQPIPSLVFFTDGQQTPLSIKEPPFILEKGGVPGLLIGVGNLQAVAVPKLDQNNIPQGYWQFSEVESLSGNQPQTMGPDGKYLSSLKENELKRLAGITGLHYQPLLNPEQLNNVLQSSGLGQPQSIAVDQSWVLVIAALTLFIIPYFRFTDANR